MGGGCREEGLFFGNVGIRGVDGPCFGFGVEVGVLASQATQDLPRALWVVVFREPFGRFGDREKGEELGDSDKPCGGEDETPGGVVTEEVAEKLRREDPDVDHHLGEGSEEALFRRRGHFGDVDWDYYDGCPSA